jgi:hypothetical protein
MLKHEVELNADFGLHSKYSKSKIIFLLPTLRNRGKDFFSTRNVGIIDSAD